MGHGDSMKRKRAEKARRSMAPTVKGKCVICNKKEVLSNQPCPDSSMNHLILEGHPR